MCSSVILGNGPYIIHDSEKDLRATNYTKLLKKVSIIFAPYLINQGYLGLPQYVVVGDSTGFQVPCRLDLPIQ